MNTPKWIPKHNVDTVKLFDQTRQLEREIRFLCRRFTQDIRMDVPDFYVSFRAHAAHLYGHGLIRASSRMRI